MFVKYITQKGTVIKVGEVEIHIIDLAGSTVRIGIEAPRYMRIEHDAFLRRDLPPKPPRRDFTTRPDADRLNRK